MAKRNSTIQITWEHVQNTAEYRYNHPPEIHWYTSRYYSWIHPVGISLLDLSLAWPNTYLSDHNHIKRLSASLIFRGAAGAFLQLFHRASTVGLEAANSSDTSAICPRRRSGHWEVKCCNIGVINEYRILLSLV